MVTWPYYDVIGHVTSKIENLKNTSKIYVWYIVGKRIENPTKWAKNQIHISYYDVMITWPKTGNFEKYLKYICAIYRWKENWKSKNMRPKSTSCVISFKFYSNFSDLPIFSLFFIWPRDPHFYYKIPPNYFYITSHP